MKIGIKIREVTPVNVRENAAPSKPYKGTRIKSETRYCIAATANSEPDNFGFPIPISMEERVRPNIRRKVPIISIRRGIIAP